MKTKLELLSPAGNLTTFQAVIQAGADAVYFGGSSFGARAYGKIFQKRKCFWLLILPISMEKKHI